MTLNWMTEKQKEDFETACLEIDGIQNAKDFYRVMKKLNSGRYDFDAVMCAREYKHCYNSMCFGV